jgi:hypothetical protein
MSQQIPRALTLRRTGASSVVVFNPLAEAVTEVVSVFVESSDVCVTEAESGREMSYQTNPTWNVSGFFRLDITFVEIIFVAKLEPLSITRFQGRDSSNSYQDFIKISLPVSITRLLST